MKPAKCMRRFLPSRQILLHFFLLVAFSGLSLMVQAQQPDTDKGILLRLNEINTTAARHLLTNFSFSTHVKWFREKHHFIAIGQEGDSTVRVYYKINGNFEYCLKYYLADALDRNLKSTVLNKFPGCKIMVVTKLTNLAKEELFIRIKDGGFIRTVHFSDEGMEITENILDITS